MGAMRPVSARRKNRPQRPLSRNGLPSALRSFLCVDLRGVENNWNQKPVDELRTMSRGSRLGAMLATLDVDPRHPLGKNSQRLPPERAFALFDALCEELADLVLFDVPDVAWRPLLAILAPSESAESPYPKELHSTTLDTSGEGLLLLVEGRLAAEAASVALAPSSLPSSEGLDPLLWSDIRLAVLPMLESVRDKNRCMLAEV